MKNHNNPSQAIQEIFDGYMIYAKVSLQESTEDGKSRLIIRLTNPPLEDIDFIGQSGTGLSCEDIIRRMKEEGWTHRENQSDTIERLQSSINLAIKQRNIGNAFSATKIDDGESIAIDFSSSFFNQEGIQVLRRAINDAISITFFNKNPDDLKISPDPNKYHIAGSAPEPVNDRSA